MSGDCRCTEVLSDGRHTLPCRLNRRDHAPSPTPAAGALRGEEETT